MALDLSFFVILFGGVLVLLVVLGTWVLWKPLLALVPAPPDAVRRELGVPHSGNRLSRRGRQGRPPREGRLARPGQTPRPPRRAWHADPIRGGRDQPRVEHRAGHGLDHLPGGHRRGGRHRDPRAGPRFRPFPGRASPRKSPARNPSAYGCAVPSPGGAQRGPTSFARGLGLRARGAAECGRDRPLRRPHRLGRRIPRLRAGRPVSAAQSPAVLSGPRFFRLRPDGRFGLVARVPAAFPEDSGARRGCEFLSDGMDAPDAPGFSHGGTSGRPRDAPPGGHTLPRVARGPGRPAALA